MTNKQRLKALLKIALQKIARRNYFKEQTKRSDALIAILIRNNGEINNEH